MEAVMFRKFSLVPIILIVLILFSGCKLTLKRQKLFTDGTLKEEFRFYYNKDKKVIKHGMFTRYYPGYKDRATGEFVQGLIKDSGKYKHGNRSGEWIFYYNNSQIRQIAHYRKGKQHGKFENYTKDGRLISEVTFKNDEVVKRKNYKISGYREEIYHTKKGSRTIGGTKPIDDDTYDSKEDFDCKRDQSNQYSIELEPFSKEPLTGKHQVKFKSGEIKEEGTYKNRQLNGKYTAYYYNGKKWMEGNYDCGLRIGKWHYWYDDGTLAADGSFQDGKPFTVHGDNFVHESGREGIWNFYNKKGVMIKELNYEDNRYIGIQTYWYDNGVVQKQEIYKNHLYKKVILFNIENYKISETEYKGSYKDGTYVRYFKTGEVKVTGQFRKNMRVGVWKYYSITGKEIGVSNDPKFIKLYGKRPIQIKDGEFISYYETGFIKESGYYDKGTMVGKWKFYNRKGKLKKELNYTKNLLNGKYSDKYANGVKRVEGFYKSGKFHGDYKERHPNGSLKLQAHYIEGILEGDYISYYDNGKIEMEGPYKKGKKVGVWKSYYSNGNKKSILKYNEQKDLYHHQAWSSAGKLIEEGEYVFTFVKGLRSKKVVKSKYKFAEDEIEMIFHPIKSKFLKTGIWKTYYDTGQMDTFTACGSGPDSKKIIKWRKGGTKLYERNYRFGKPHGIWVLYHLTGELYQEGKYKDGKEIGIWKEYDSRGILIEERNYDVQK